MLNVNLKEVERKYERRENSFRGDYRSSNISNRNNDFVVERGCVYWANLGETKGSIQGKIRPFLVTSNWRCNKNSSVITGIALTSQLHKKNIPTHVVISTVCGIDSESIALCEQVMPLNKSDLISKIGYCTKEEMIEVEKAIQIQNGIEIKDVNELNQKQGRYYSTIEKFQNDIFDIYKVKRMTKTITELERFVCKYDNPEVNPVKDSIEIHIAELKDYCEKHNQDYKLFYKPIINKMGRYKGAVVNA